jgi:hypothetical protein
LQNPSEENGDWKRQWGKGREFAEGWRAFLMAVLGNIFGFPMSFTLAQILFSGELGNGLNVVGESDWTWRHPTQALR